MNSSSSSCLTLSLRIYALATGESTFLDFKATSESLSLKELQLESFRFKDVAGLAVPASRSGASR